MKASLFLAPLAIACALLAGCTSASTTPAASTAVPQTPPSSTANVAAKPVVHTVPTDLAGKTMGEAKALLAKAGFTNIVVAGGMSRTRTRSSPYRRPARSWHPQRSSA